MTPTPTTPHDEPESPSLAAYLYANDFSIYEILESWPALEIDALPPSLRLARRFAAEIEGEGGGASR